LKKRRKMKTKFDWKSVKIAALCVYIILTTLCCCFFAVIASPSPSNTVEVTRIVPVVMVWTPTLIPYASRTPLPAPRTQVPTSQPTNASSPTLEPTELPTNTLIPVSPSFKSLCEKDTANMTEVQVERYSESLSGITISNWRGQVYDVREDGYGTYTVSVSMEPDSFLFTRDVEIHGLDSSVADLNVHQWVIFNGVVERAEIFLNSICNPIVIKTSFFAREQ
jgi:hypothetical protein